MSPLFALVAHSLPAAAAPTATELQAFTETGVAARPDAEGDGRLLLSEQVGLDLGVGEHWRVSAEGGVRKRAPADTVDRLDLHRLVLGRSGDRVDVRAGRLVTLDARGVTRLDGVVAGVDPDGVVAGGAWAGRQWHPETWDLGGPGGGCDPCGLDRPWLGGALVELRPLADGVRSRLTRAAAGYEARVAGALEHRLFASAATSTPGGRSLLVDGEASVPGADEGELRGRAGVRGGLPLTRRVLWAAEARWEDLPAVSAPGTVRTPEQWLAPDGYGLVATSARWVGGPVTAELGGGPTFASCPTSVPATLTTMGRAPPEEPECPPGAAARASVGAASGRASAGLYARVAGIGGTSVAGGGGELGYAFVTLSGGLYRLEPLDGRVADVWEARLQADPRAASRTGERAVDVLGELGVGTDRLLQPWVRGGVAVRGTLGPPRAASGSGGGW